VHSCRGICDLIKLKHLIQPIYKWQRRCKNCEVYYNKDILICPCCKSQTRNKPYQRIYRLKYEPNDILEEPIYSSMSYEKLCE